MKHLAPVVVCAGVMVLSSIALAQTTFAQTQGTGGPSYSSSAGTSPAGRSPTTPGVAIPTPRSGAVQSTTQPVGTRSTTTPGPSASEFGTQVPGVTR
jgi:hypothetical protein